MVRPTRTAMDEGARMPTTADPTTAPGPPVIQLPAPKREAIKKALAKHYGLSGPKGRSTVVVKLGREIRPGGDVLERMYRVAQATSPPQSR
jgi:hypothetical protein